MVETRDLMHSQKVLDLLVLCIIINLCLECFHCYVIIDCWLTLILYFSTDEVALINHLLTYLLTCPLVVSWFLNWCCFRCNQLSNVRGLFPEWKVCLCLYTEESRLCRLTGILRMDCRHLLRWMMVSSCHCSVSGRTSCRVPTEATPRRSHLSLCRMAIVCSTRPLLIGMLTACLPDLTHIIFYTIQSVYTQGWRCV